MAEEVNKSEAIRDVFKSNPNAKAQEVVDALAKKGVTVTVSLVHTVKSKHNQRQAAKKAAKKAAQRPVAEAKTEGISKSQAIRDYLKANKKAKPQEVVDALKKQGIETTANYVSNLRAKRKTRRKAVKQVVAAVAPTGIGVPQIKTALAFLKAVGSDAIAKQALAAAIEIKKIV